MRNTTETFFIFFYKGTLKVEGEREHFPVGIRWVYGWVVYFDGGWGVSFDSGSHRLRKSKTEGETKWR